MAACAARERGAIARLQVVAAGAIKAADDRAIRHCGLPP
jgi:hypothetical protein